MWSPAQWLHCKVDFITETPNNPNMDTTSSSCLILVSILATARSEIIKPWREWLCNYCSMGESEVSTDRAEQCRGGDFRFWFLFCFSGLRGQRRVRDSDTVSLLRAVVTHHPLHHLHNHQRNQRIISLSVKAVPALAEYCRYDYNSILVKTVPVCFVLLISVFE